MARTAKPKQPEHKPHIYRDGRHWVVLGASGLKGYGLTIEAAWAMFQFELRTAA